MSTTGTEATKAYGFLAAKYGHSQRELQVCRSAAGFYIGTLGDDGTPFTRESVEYFETSELCEAALTNGGWEQKPQP